MKEATGIAQLSPDELKRLRQRLQELGARSQGLELVARSRPPRIPLSFSQERLWFLEQLEQSHGIYNISVALRLKGVLDAAALRAALNTLVQRHDVLRTTFHPADGKTVQVIGEDPGFCLEESDVRQLAASEREVEVSRQILAEAGTPFELSVGPLIRGRLIRVHDEDHVLLISAHHIVSDGWSMRILLREFAIVYGAYRAGRDNPLPMVAIQYADYALWQRQWQQVEAQVLKRQLAYWVEQLRGAPALLKLPTDRVRTSQRSYEGGRVEFVLSAELTGGLKRLAREQEATLFMVLTAGFVILLSRLSGEQDVVVGTPVANRQQAQLERMIGCFVNTLALRVRLNGAWSVRELLRHVREVTLQGYSHQEIPFEQVVEAVQPPRNLSHSPIFQVMLGLDNSPRSDMQLAGLTAVAQEQPDALTVQFDLTLGLMESGSTLCGGIEYACDVFDRATIQRWAGHYQEVLRGMLANVDQEIGTIELLSRSERRQLIEAFNDAVLPQSTDRCIHELFEAQVERTPAASAVEHEGRTVSYGELNRRANQLAHHLRTLGVGPDRRVAICAERSVEQVIGLLAVLKAGGAYVPLDPAYPRDRLEYMLADAAPAVLLVHLPGREPNAVSAAWRELQVPIIDLQADEPSWQREPSENLRTQSVGLTCRHLAYVIYTSGSTGAPKGVMVEHASVVDHCLFACIQYKLSSSDRVLQFASLCFDVAVEEIIPTLLVGASVVMRCESTPTIEAFSATLLREQITVLNIPTAYWHVWVAGISDDFVRASVLRLVIVGGEKVRADSVRAWNRQVRGRIEWMNAYGPTESTVGCTTYCLQGGAEEGEIPIGRPNPNHRIYILDPARAPVPIGVAGEIYVAGSGVARGYLNLPAQTAQRFLEDPFRPLEDARMYRTGDLGRWRPDGNIEYLGRNDDQVKLRGYRIELAEIEAQLARCAGIKEAVVVARHCPPDEMQLVAYFTVADDAQASVDRIREALSSRLPEYMHPAAYLQLDFIPWTPNGKVDRKALPVPGASIRAQEPPQGETEALIGRIWQEVLHLPFIGRQDNFFELGGHSLLAIQVVARVNSILHRELSVRDIFEHPTIQALAASLAHDTPVEDQPIARTDRTRPLPLSSAQQRLWLLNQFDGAAAAYHMLEAVRLRGTLDLIALQGTLDTIVARHESLRTHFVQVNGEVVQVIGEERSVAISMFDVSALHGPERELEILRHGAQEIARRFDLSTDLPLRVCLLRVTNEEHVLLLTIHHIACDGWSCAVLTGEITRLYEAFSNDLSNPLAPLSLQYADYAVWELERLKSGALNEQVSYWKNQLAGAPPLLELPSDKERPPVESYRGDGVDFSLGGILSEQLRTLSRQHDLTLFMTLLAGFALVLARLSGQRDIVIGTPVANRTQPEVEGLIGCFVNTLALRVRLHEGQTMRELLEQVRELTLGAYDNQELPFERVVEAVRPPRSLSHSPIFQVMLALNNTPQSKWQLAGIAPSQSAVATTVAQFDMTLVVQETDSGGIAGCFNFATDLFTRPTVERWVGHFKAALEAMVADPRRKLADIELLRVQERRRLVDEFNATQVAYPVRKPVHQLFEAQVQRSPEALAVWSEQQALTYRELDRLSSALAARLRQAGVRAGDYVATFIQETHQIAVVWLGILRAGAAFMPLSLKHDQRTAGQLSSLGACRAAVVDCDHSDLTDVDLGQMPVLDVRAAGASFDQRIEESDLSSAIYVMHTSGSTGLQKGVVVEHLAIVNRLMWMNDAFGAEGARCVIKTTQQFFDSAVWQVFWPLINGGCCVIADLSRNGLDELLPLLRRFSVSTIDFVPSVFRAFMEVAESELPAGFKIASNVIFGGEEISAESVAWLKRRAAVGRIFNLYGPTEASIGCVFHEVAECGDGRVPIGRPIANARIYILNDRQQPVPIGVCGEIYIGGVPVARGYLDSHELTAQRFLKDPFTDQAGARMYRTGDLGRWRCDGNIEYLGRNDHQVKIRGYRIELADIEAHLARHPSIHEVAVSAPVAESGERRLVAYVTAAFGSEVPSSEALRSHLKNHVPDHMIPSAFVWLASMPRLPGGKIDRAALPRPEPEVLSARAFEPPQGEVEELVARIWQELLLVKQVGRQDDFFELGGHSLLAVRLLARIRDQYVPTLTLREIFAFPVLKSFAARITDEFTDWKRYSRLRFDSDRDAEDGALQDEVVL